jgi:hypothetical protein
MMKNLLWTIVACLVALHAQAMEYETQFEDDHVRIGKAQIGPYEEFSHRAHYPQVLIALKGGALQSVEVDGKVTELPTGVPVYREADAKEERSRNDSSEPIELVVVQLKNSPPVTTNKKEHSHDLFLSVKLNCPTSPELQEFVQSIPPADYQSVGYEDWKMSFLNNMNHLMRLVESEKVFESWWWVTTHENP